MRVLIVPDKFKGTLTATQAAEAIAEGWRQARPGDELELLPMSDGGDGFGELLGRHLEAEERTVATVDAAHRPIQAVWWWEPRWKTAIIESARVIGLAQLPPNQFHPFQLDSFGLGAVLQAAARMHPRLCLVGIGGSATNDGGFGLARALGWQFLDKRYLPIEQWTRLPDLARLVRPARPLRFRKLVIAVDVRNRLLGVRGATRIYGPQKGLRPEDFKPAERCLRRMARVVATQLRIGRDIHHLPGTGAAGGLGYGLIVFANAPLTSGFRLFAVHTELKTRIRAAQLVITGEGSIDFSSVLGKGVGQVAHWARRFGIPCLGLGGVLADVDRTAKYFTQLHSLTPTLTTPDRAVAEPALWLRQLAEQTAKSWPNPACPPGAFTPPAA